jgi:23S rRNA pseudouridine1911/1915/1917 synthase
MPRVTHEHLVPDGTEPQRLDYYACEVFDEIASPTQARKLRKKGGLRLNGAAQLEPAMIGPGDRLQYVFPDVNRRVVEIPEEVEVAFEDAHMAVVVKPAGLRTSGKQRRTLVNVIQPSDEPDVLSWPHTVHRLDIRTGGLIAVAKTARANVALGRAFQQRTVQKRYVAIAVGRLEGACVVDRPVEGRPARTRFAVQRHIPSHVLGWLTEVHCWPETGRNHQIRRHLAHLGHPILGDDVYTGEVPNIMKKGLYLWAAELRLEHPLTGAPLRVEAPPSRRFNRYVNWHRDRFLDGGAGSRAARGLD